VAKNQPMTPFGPVDPTFSWTGVPVTDFAAPHRSRRGRHAAVEPPSPPGMHPGVLPPLPVRSRPRRARSMTPPPDRPDLDTMRRVLAALYRL